MTEFDDMVEEASKVSRHANKWFAVTALQLVSLVVVLVCMETRYHPVHWFLFVSQFVSAIVSNCAAHSANYKCIAMAYQRTACMDEATRRLLRRRTHA